MIIIKINYASTLPNVNITYDNSVIYAKVVYGDGNDGTATWGLINGTLSNQTDLQNALNAKVPYSGATANVDLGEYELKAGQVELDQTPTGVAGVAVTRWNDTVGTIETTLKGGNVVLKHGRDMFERVVNKTGIQLTKAAYQAVKVSDAQGQRLAVDLAQANNDNNSADTIGIVVETIDNNQEGFIYTVGEVDGINTTGSLQSETWSDGDVLYLSPTTAGRITNVKPVAPQHLVIMGYVVYAHANNGKIYVKITNGYELGELHDVNTTGATNGQVLAYNSTSGIWEPTTNGSGTVTSVAVSGGTGISVSGSPITSSGTITVTNSAPDQVVSLTGAGTTSISGTYPSFTITSNDQYVGTVTSVGLTSATSGVTIGSSPITTSGNISLTIATASGSQNGLLSSTDWTTFNNKQNALTNPVTGTGTSGQVAYWSGTNTQTGSNNLFWDIANGRLGVGTNTPRSKAEIAALGDTGLYISSFLNTTSGVASLNFQKSQFSTVGVLSTTGTGSTLGTIFFRGVDSGNNSDDGAYITAVQDGTAGSFRIPAYLDFGTGDETNNPTSRLRIQKSGNILIGSTTDSGQRLQVTGTSYFSDSVGIGITPNTNYGIRLARTITSNVDSNGISSEGQVQSDVTSSANLFNSVSNTQNATFTLTGLRHYRAVQGTFGASSTVTNQFGFLAESNLTGATNNYGFYGNIPSGTNRWNLYMNGAANNYMAGSLGIGSTSLSIYNLRIQKNITGGTIALGISNESVVQSDVTSQARYYDTSASTAATTFTLNQLFHYRAGQGTFGAGSTINNQVGFVVDPSCIGAAFNVAFQGSIPFGTGRWNSYMDGTASNYMAGSLGIGTTSLTLGKLNISGSGIDRAVNIVFTFSGATTRHGILQYNTINSDVTSQAVNYYSQFATQAASFTITNVRDYIVGDIALGAGSTVTNHSGFYCGDMIQATNNYAFHGGISAGSNKWNLYMNGTAANYLAGNLSIGTTTTTYGLNLGGSTAASNIISSNSPSDYTVIYSRINSASAWGIDNIAGKMQFYLTSYRGGFFTNGNFQIGDMASDSGEKLQVTGTSKFTGVLSGGTSTFSTAIGINTTTYSGKLTILGDNDQIYLNTAAGYSSIYFAFNSTTRGVIYVNNTETHLEGRGTSGLFLGGASGQNHLTIASTGAATFNSSVTAASYTINDAGNIVVGTTTGTKIGTATSQKLAFWNATPIVQPTTAIAEATFVENSGGTAVNVDSTFAGYTLQQIAQALKNMGILA